MKFLKHGYKTLIIVAVFFAAPLFVFADGTSEYGEYVDYQWGQTRAPAPVVAERPSLGTCNGCGLEAGSDDCLGCSAPSQPRTVYTQPRNSFVNDLLDLNLGYTSVKYDNDTNIDIDDHTKINYNVRNTDNSNRSVRTNNSYTDNSFYDGSIVINSDNDVEIEYDISDRYRYRDYYYDYDDDDDDRDVTIVGSSNNLPDGNLASLNSVFLSQVPYTGASDTLLMIGYGAAILVWSVLIVFFFAKLRRKSQISKGIQAFKDQNRQSEVIA